MEALLKDMLDRLCAVIEIGLSCVVGGLIDLKRVSEAAGESLVVRRGSCRRSGVVRDI